MTADDAVITAPAIDRTDTVGEVRPSYRPGDDAGGGE